MANHLSRGFKRSALTLALGLCFAGSVSAQTAVGSIFGHTTANETVTITNQATNLSREITAGADGRFSFTQLPPGRYTVTSKQGTQDVLVRVGTGTPVAFAPQGDATTLGTVTVVGAASFNPIDVSSVESTTVFTAEQIDQLPVARDVTSVALLAPGTVKGDSGFGNLASFGGSSVAENGYYINGMDVTNIRTFLSFADMPFDAIDQQQIKTGGYGAEYGRSLGGVVSIITKRGTNEWKGGASAYWSPAALRADGRDTMSVDPDRIGTDDDRLVYRSDNEFERLTYNIYGGGPLIKDRLFAFALIEGRRNIDDTYTRIDSQNREDTSPNALLKLDWNITDNHILEFTGIYNKAKEDVINYVNPDGAFYTGSHGSVASKTSLENGGEVYIARYTGYLTDSFTLSAQAGYLRNVNNFQPLLPGADCPAIYDSRGPGTPLAPIGCWTEAQFTVRDPAFGGGPDEDKRKAYRIDAEWQLGSHQLRFGLDQENFRSTHAGAIYSGGEYFRYFRSIDVFGVDIGDVARRRTTFSESGSFEVVNNAAYIEDSWQALDNLVLYAGLRSETFENKNGHGETFIESDQLIAPRLGFSWDVNGDSTFKVFGNAGRYYIPVASNTNIRGSSAEYSDTTWYELTGVNPDGTPILGAVVIDTDANGSMTPPDARTIAATNLDPMYQDEYILGFQKQLSANWSLGVRAIYRQVQAGFDDSCAHNGFNQWAADNGYVDDFATNEVGIDMPTCYIINPGSDVSLALDPDDNGTLEVYNVPASYLDLPEYRRSYSALEVFWEKAKADNWYMQGSYTFARGRGNVEGYVNSTLEQEDAGATQDFDFPAFTHGTYGYLPNDRRHALKLFGAYDINDEWTVSANMLLQSGRPVNCNGFIPVGALGIVDPDAGAIGNYSSSSFYCPDPNGEFLEQGDPLDPSDDVRFRLGNRGDQGRTPWNRTFDLGVSYQPKWANDKLNLQMKVFNVLDSSTVTEYNETATNFNTETTTSPDFLNAVNYVSPRYVRFAIRYEF